MSILSYNGSNIHKIKKITFLIFILFSALFLLYPKGELFANVQWPHFEPDKDGRIKEDEKCFKCHMRKTVYYNPEEPFQNLRFDYEEMCKSCHNKRPKICDMTLVPGNYKMLFIQIPSFPLPLFNERVTCASCHYNHQKAQNTNLREEYKLLKIQAEKVINPHKTGVFCFLCHKNEPEGEGKALYLKYQDDTVRLCRDCHNDIRARADNHPVNIRPVQQEQGIKIPEAFPLKDGKITCITCHKLKCQGTVTNPYFLRGGPYVKRTDTCLACHLEEKYRKDNPHEIISDQGKMVAEKCMICHSLETDEKGQKIFGFKFKKPFRLYCIGCHPVEVKRHPFGANHTGQYVESIWGGMSAAERLKIAYEQSFKISPVTLSGQVTCTTCHNPHDPRPGAKLRIIDLNFSCRQCHYKQYAKEFPGTHTDFTRYFQPTKEDLEPKGDDLYPLGYRASIRFYCIGCHANKDRRHPYGIDHNGRFITSFWKYLPFEKRIELAQTQGPKPFPLTTNGQIACFTCHDPHDGKKGNKLRIEARDILCSLCHTDKSFIIEIYKKGIRENQADEAVEDEGEEAPVKPEGNAT